MRHGIAPYQLAGDEHDARLRVALVTRLGGEHRGRFTVGNGNSAEDRVDAVLVSPARQVRAVTSAALQDARWLSAFASANALHRQ
ncbi:NIPSNAP family protein [Xanthomonas euvesicatoria]|uniref:NIPSNAP family protein n=1 Tax=Xanthomonas euvesicatoria TaxID=456327 RepID=UPI001E575D13|nr:NIPSNAP family protein [Xanthomonas euvesicatoria]